MGQIQSEIPFGELPLNTTRTNGTLKEIIKHANKQARNASTQSIKQASNQTKRQASTQASTHTNKQTHTHTQAHTHTHMWLCFEWGTPHTQVRSITPLLNGIQALKLFPRKPACVWVSSSRWRGGGGGCRGEGQDVRCL